MTTIKLTWSAACAGSSGIPAERGAIPMSEALRLGSTVPVSRGVRVRHVAWQQRKQGRSVFTGTNPLAPCSMNYMAQANLRIDVAVMNDDKVWGPAPWRPPPV